MSPTATPEPAAVTAALPDAMMTPAPAPTKVGAAIYTFVAESTIRSATALILP